MPKQVKTHILLIEDNPGDARVTQVLLHGDPLCEYSFTHCATLREANAYLVNNNPDIVLLDLNLPDSTGLDTYRALQKEFPGLPVVIMSGNNDLDLAAKAVRAGAQDYIIKGSLDGENLARVVRYAIERKKVVKKLEESEKQYRQIVETAREGMWIIKPDDSVAFVNQELADILGYKRDEIVGSNSLNYVLQEDREELRQKIRNRRSGIKETYEFRVLRSDGKPLPVLISSTPNFDDQGNYSGALAMITDISYRKQAEQAVRQERDLAQRYFDIAGAILLVLDDQGIIERINQKGLSILGYQTAGDLVGRNWFETCVPRELRKWTSATYQKLLDASGDAAVNIEGQVLTATDEVRHVAWHITTIRGQDGDRNTGTLSSGEDITERVIADQQRELLLHLSRQAALETDFDQLLFFITDQLLKIIPPAQSSSIFMVDYEKEIASLKAWAGFGAENLKGFEVPLKDYITNRVITTKKATHVGDVAADPEFVSIEDARMAPIKSSIAAPILAKDGSCFGLIFCDSRQKTHAFSDSDLALLETICNQLSGVIENVRLMDRLRNQHADLQQSQAQYRDLFNTIFNGFALHEMIYDADGKPVDYRFLEINPAFSRMTGLKEDDVIGRSVLEVLPETEPYWIETYGKVVNTGKPLRIENFSGAFEKYFDVIAFSPAKGQFATVISDITEQRQLISELQSERDRAQNYLDIAEVMIVALDERGIITLANRKSCAVLGYREDQLVGKNWFKDCVPHGDYDRAWALYADFLSSDDMTGPNYEQVFITSSGEKRTARWQSRKLVNQHGDPTGTLSSGEDITEQKKAEELLRQYERIVASSSDMIALVNAEQEYLAANDKYALAFGLTSDEIIGKNARDLFDDGFFNKVLQPHVDQCLKGEEVVFNEWINLPDAGRRYMETRYYPYFGAGDNVLGVVINRRDITEQHHIQQALQNSETRLRNIINNSTNMFYSHTPAHKLTFVSPQSKAILGYEPDELLIKWTDLTTGNPINQDGVSHTERAIATGQAQPPYQLELLSKNGRHVWVEVHEAPIVEDGRVTAIVGSLTNITTRRRAEMENQQSLAALKIANVDLRHAYDRLQHVMESTIRTIAKTVEVRDPYTAGHHRRVSELSVRIAQVLGLEDETVKAIELAAVIHDLGKIQVPAEILSKPGKLTEIEFGLVKTHPTVGYQLLKDIEFPWPLAEIIYMHHERMDGSGYPRGLTGNDIPIESRIISVADTVEAMSSHRPYRASLGIERALEQIKADSGMYYDPSVVDTCLHIFEDGFQFSEE